MFKYSQIGLIFFVGTAGIIQAQIPGTPPDVFSFSNQGNYYLHRTYAPDRVFTLAAEVGFNNYLQGGGRIWGRGLDDYRNSLASAFGQRVIANTTELFIGQLIGDDTRYQPSTKKKIFPRVGHALLGTITAHTRDGGIRPAYSGFIALATGVAVSNQQRPYPKSPGNVSETIVIGLTDKIFPNLSKEFHIEERLKRWGSNLFYKLLFGFRIKERDSAEPRKPPKP